MTAFTAAFQRVALSSVAALFVAAVAVSAAVPLSPIVA